MNINFHCPHMNRMISREEFEQEPDQLSEWEYLVDADGVYTPEEYASKLHVKLPKNDRLFE